MLRVGVYFILELCYYIGRNFLWWDVVMDAVGSNSDNISNYDLEISAKRNISYHFYIFFKRLFDLVFSFFALLFMIPLIIIIKIIYLINGDYKSIFYSQPRIGKNGKIFSLFKFRSMVSNADEVLKELLKDPKYKSEWEQNQKFDNDPRITKVGHFLRKTSLDEFPQFINVLFGQMSIIGPRPLVPGELDAHKGNHALYESVKPGISGYWATHGRSSTNYDERLNLEYYYCKNASLILDIKIVFMTIYVVFKRHGAK